MQSNNGSPLSIDSCKALVGTWIWPNFFFWIWNFVAASLVKRSSPRVSHCVCGRFWERHHPSMLHVNSKTTSTHTPGFHPQLCAWKLIATWRFWCVVVGPGRLTLGWRFNQLSLSKHTWVNVTAFPVFLSSSTRAISICDAAKKRSQLLTSAANTSWVFPPRQTKCLKPLTPTASWKEFGTGDPKCSWSLMHPREEGIPSILQGVHGAEAEVWKGGSHRIPISMCETAELPW